MENMREATEWSASTATLPLEKASPRSLEDDEESLTEEDAAWAAEGRSRKGLRTLLLEMDVADDEAPSTARQPADDRGDERESDGVAQKAELRLAEECVRALEARLLDAEETIHHLKAEKMDAWRRVERLTRSASAAEDGREQNADGGDVVVRLRAQVYELEGQLTDQQTQHAVELEEHMAVIREQEREIMELNERLHDVQDHADEVENKYEQLLAARDRAIAYEQKEEDEDEDPLKTLSGLDVTWQEDFIRHPTPHFDLDSPEVQYLLCSWTKNPKKLQYLRTWLTHVSLSNQRELPLDFPMGIELPRLAPEIKDGFLTLVVPLLRKQPWREIQVHTKQYNDGFHADLRIRVIPRRP